MNATMTNAPVNLLISPIPALPQRCALAADLEAGQIAAAQAGDLAAFNPLVLAYQTVAFSLALRMLRQEQRAGDVVQASFINAYQTIKTFTGGSFKCWLLRIVSNGSFAQLRKGQHALFKHLNRRAERQVLLLSPTELLERAINTIPPDLRMALLLRDVHGQSCEEVAMITATLLETVKVQLSRARSLVCAYLAGTVFPAALPNGLPQLRLLWTPQSS